MSSIMVPKGAIVELFDQDGFRGQKLKLFGGWTNDKKQEMECIDLPSRGWNDKVSSLIVMRAEYGEKAKGHWSRVASSSEPIIMEFEIGVEGVNTNKYSKEVANKIDAQMTSGIEFEPSAGVKLSSSYTISTQYATTIRNEVTSSVKRWEKKKYPQNCKEEWTPGQMASLWQFVVETNDEKN